MPYAMADEVRAFVARMYKGDLVVQESPTSATRYTNVIELKNGKYQARLQVKGDGRGGVRKRKQYSLPGIFDTALEAAQYLAFVKTQPNAWENGVPPKQFPDRKPRENKPATRIEPAATPVSPAALAPQMPLVMTTGFPIPHMMMNAPLVAATPVPMRSLGYTPPFGFASM
jgi:hypothetical protein